MMGQQPATRRSSMRVPGPLLLALLLASCHLQQAGALYHTSSEVLHWFSNWAAKRPDVLRFRELHERQSSTVLPVATITQDLNSPGHKPRPAVLFVFGEHARELITPEVGIWLSRLLVDTNSSVYDWPELSAAFERAGLDASGRSSSTANRTTTTSSSSSSRAAGSKQTDWLAVVRGWVKDILASLEVVVVPIEALDSRRLVEAGQLCVRKTASNVDLNRNWPFAWKKESATDEQYGGPNPFSEPQSRLMKHLIDHLHGRLLGYVNVHSGESALYTPWDSKEAYGPGLPADLPDLVAKVGRLCDCMAGPAGAVSGYLAYGTSMDYLYVHRRVPYPLTVEVYGGGAAGKLRPGQANKELTDWPTVTKAGAPTSAGAQFQRRRLQQQQQEEEESGVVRVSVGRRLLGWIRALLQATQQQQAGGGGAAAGSYHHQQQQQEGQLQHQHKALRRRRRRRRHAKQLGLLPDGDTPAAAAAAVATAAVPDSSSSEAAQAAAATAEAAAAAAGGGFSAGGNLAQLRQQAKQQLLQDKQQQARSSSGGGAPGVLSIANDPQGAQQQQPPQQPPAGGGEADPIMSMVAAAPVHQRSCFDAFNPVHEGEYRRVVADWLAASLIMLKHMLDGEEGQRMIAQVAAGARLQEPATASSSSSGGGSSGITVRDPTSAAAAAGAGRNGTGSKPADGRH